MKDLKIFSEGNWSVRTIKKGQTVFFVARDIAEALGYKNTRNAIARHCKRQVTALKEGGGQRVLIPEPDVYRLVIKSRMPEAEKFEEWVMEKILPSIRKTGTYSMEPEKEGKPVSSKKSLEDFEKSLKLIESLKKDYCVSESSILNAMYNLLDEHNLSTTCLPEYVDSKGELASGSELLTRFGFDDMSMKKLNPILLKRGYLKKIERESLKNPDKIKTCWILTEKGMDYGENQNIARIHKTDIQPRYYIDRFEELYGKLVRAEMEEEQRDRKLKLEWERDYGKQ